MLDGRQCGLGLGPADHLAALSACIEMAQLLLGGLSGLDRLPLDHYFVDSVHQALLVVPESQLDHALIVVSGGHHLSW